METDKSKYSNVIDMIASDVTASEISDAMKNALYTKAAEKIENLRPIVASSLFGGESEIDQETPEEQE